MAHPLADEVGRVLWAFDPGDARRDAVRHLALRVADLEDECHRRGLLLMKERAVCAEHAAALKMDPNINSALRDLAEARVRVKELEEELGRG